MHSLEDLFDDPHLEAVNFFGNEDHPTEGRLKHIRPPIRMSKSKPGPGRPAEHTGQSTRDLLRQAGMSDAEIDTLIANRAAGEHAKG
jgi:crotonobetainyl-CoA:carnitine CoA-transferase CaiB-like acyl-CoA transferase